MATVIIQGGPFIEDWKDIQLDGFPQPQQHTVNVDFKQFFGVDPRHVNRSFLLSLSDLTYQPKIHDPSADWAVTAAFRSFKVLQAANYGPVRRFATIGTGSGTDAIAALDLFPQLRRIVMTDLHEEVVAQAQMNLKSAVDRADDRVRDVARDAVGLTGHSLVPLRGQMPFDLIYENLPNIPVPEGVDLRDGQTSSSFFDAADVSGVVPPFVSAALLDLHYVCLLQARTFGLLTDHGVILSSMGGRVPISLMLDLAHVVGFTGRIISMTWKVQSEPDSVIGGYAEQQEKGLGPFYFYRTSSLQRVFDGRTPAGAGLCALQIENDLLPDRLDAVAALRAHRQGIEIGHPVVVMASVLK
ncbi:hypothetical protein BO70DRAFT_334613 [Aspergillus heteromorphus CBS 117.55]|uniref:S-adenosyl-L-methionine-dependent methyltransferase n=1 Tax=Aspergillus heteromorphus CBS 117.55 TaxID=1448321 RepID=A0A317WGC1_9EURO|nr:uncharacterized protein BO70DRAFT_334613 [Aspergillus heteromorphus CBS 117.55]PWY84751.1 hypothetical protein BO70DRAFT_334613 [Aspergillus heteromorphus CBS 117.55]